MPVRDLDDWLPGSERAIRPLSNRGANGIDGVVSTALGAAAAEVGPVVLVVGDVSFLHDLNALVSARLHGLSATIVLVDNDGGGIFSFLPQANTDAPEVGLPEHYEELFGTPHGIDVGPIVTALGGEYREVGPGIDPRRAGCVDRPAGRPGARVPDRPGAQCRAPSRGRRRRDRGPGTAVSGIVVDGLRWEVRSRGAGSPLLLIHGFTGRGTSWGHHATAFARHRRVISVDLPGHGRSGTPSDPGRASVERTADDLAVILARAAGQRRPTSSAIRWAPAWRCGSRSSTRARFAASSSRVRRAGLADRARAERPPRRRRRPGRPARARRDRGVRGRVGTPARVRQPATPARCDAPCDSVRSACAIGRPASPRACVEPARASWRHSTTASGRSELRPSSSPAPSIPQAVPGRHRRGRDPRCAPRRACRRRPHSPPRDAHRLPLARSRIP